MAEQMIITVGRQFGSGGHVIGEKLAERFGLPLYDAAILEEVAKQNDFDYEELKHMDEKWSWRELFSRRVRGMSSSMLEGVAMAQFNYIKSLADSGESFVVIGRCAENVLAGREGLITFFITADQEAKVARVSELYGRTEAEAEAMIKEIDYERKTYHNFYCERKWGDSRNYDMVVNSSRLGIDGTADFLAEYVRRRSGRE